MDNKCPLQQVVDAHPDINIIDFNFYDKNRISTQCVQDDSLEFKEELKTCQRLLRIHNDMDTMNSLYGKGYTSAMKIASIPRSTFIEEMSENLGENGEELAGEIHDKACGIKGQVFKLLAAVHNTTAPYAKALKANNISSEVSEYFEGLPSYQDIFGSLNYADTNDTMTLFSPAAYFVDLMRIEETYINAPNQLTIPDFMKLENRRPDLYYLPLTMANMNDTFPYIKIAIERMELFLSKITGEDKNLYQTLAKRIYPFDLPLQYPLERIRLYIHNMKLELSDLYEAMNVAEVLVASEELSLSAEEWALITKEDITDAGLKNRYGISDLTKLSEVKFFCDQVGINEQDLMEIIVQNLTKSEIKANLQTNFFINKGLTTPLTINDTTNGRMIETLDHKALDRLNRFIRLARKTGWSYTELDWALNCVKEDTVAITEQTLVAIAQIKKMTRLLNLSVDYACSLFHDLKTYGKDSMFDKIVNPTGVTTYHPIYNSNPTYQDSVWKWNITSKEKEDIAITSRIALSTRLSQSDTLILAGTLFQTDSPLTITVGNLSALYSHGQLMQRTKLTAKQYHILYTLSNLEEQMESATLTPIMSIRSIESLLQTVSLIHSSSLNVYEIDYIIRQTERGDITILYKEQEAKKWFETLPSFTKSNLTTEKEQQEERYNKLLTQLGSLFGVSKDQVNSMLSLSLEPDIFHIFLEERKEEEALTLLRNFSRKLMLIIKLRLTSEEAKSIETQQQEYGIHSLENITLHDILNLIQFKNMQNAYGDIYGYIIRYMDAEDENTALTIVNQLTGIEKNQIKLFFDLYPNSDKFTKLMKLQRINEILKISEVDIGFLNNITLLAGSDAQTNWDHYVQVADNLYAALRATYNKENFEVISSQLIGKEYEIKRNALIPTAISECRSKEDLNWIKNAHNLYEYLLIDVEMGGEHQISYLKEAINSVQLYMNRCREQMEPGVIQLPIPNVWWEWMSNYRLWEANRKIFLYPENYIDPARRASKTKLFKDMEDSLKQDSIKTETVEAAFRKYLEGFAQLAQLIYVDSYYCTISDNNRSNAKTLFLFARTQTQPYQYYYIIMESDGTWSDWKEIGISINADSISSVYALQRLFVFWVEITDTETSSTQNQTGNHSSNTNKATIRYSFYNFSGEWVQPQTLVTDAVISPTNKDSIPSYNGLFTKDMFDISDSWKKVYPIRIEPSSYWSLKNGSNQYEKIVLFYGPVLNTENYKNWTAPADMKAPDSSDSFLTMLYNCYKRFVYLKENNALGDLPIYETIVLNDDLESGFLANPDECIFLTKDSDLSVVHNRPIINRSSGAFGYISSINVIHDNYDQEQIISSIRLDPKKAIILSNSMRDKNYNVIQVKNNPAAMIFSGGKESFLLWDNVHGKEPINSNMYNSDTIFHAKSFIASEVGMNEIASQNTFKQLMDYGYFNEYGILEKNTDYKSLVKDIKLIMEGDPQENDKSAVVKNIIMNQPKLKNDSFIDEAVGINLTASQNIFKQLVFNGFLDMAGRLDADVDFYSLTNLMLEILEGETKLEEKVSSIVDRIFQYSYPTGLGFFEKKDEHSKDPVKFEAIRMTTAAVHKLSASLFTGGIDRLLSLSSQQIPVERELPFNRFQFNQDYINPPFVTEGAQVDFDGVYGLYYQEVFFHAPLYIYSLLKTNQKFSDAKKWIEYIFNPYVRETFLLENSFITSTIGSRKSADIYDVLLRQNIITSEGRVSDSFTKDTDLSVYLKSLLSEDQIVSVQSILLNYKLSTPYARLWQFNPFRNRTLESLLDQLGNPKEITAYNNNPFDPHAIARLRPGAYEKTVVMKYIDNLLEWGDYFFTQYTFESLNMATMLYISAYNLLGERPLMIGGSKEQKMVTFHDIQKDQTEIPQFLIDIEHIVGGCAIISTNTPIHVSDLYFTIPENKDFIAYWDKVENRLYNIRHGLNIYGKSQSLSLYDYPLDPAMLVGYQVNGGDILMLMQAGAVAVSNYRFPLLVDRAKTMIQNVIQLGNTLLSVLEKKDAEELATLRAVQERNILNLTTMTKEKQIEEAQSIIDSLGESLKSAQYKKSHYESLFNENLSELETTSLALMGTAILPQTIAVGIRGVAVASYLLPNVFGLANGGMSFGDAVNMGAAVADGTAGILTHTANMIATIAQYNRRREEWELNKEVSEYEIEQINNQITSSKARLDYLKQDLKIHNKTIEQGKEYDDYLQGKFTNEELYQWMIGRVSSLYFQTYRIAIDLSLSAQNAYQNERSTNDNFIEFQYWDSLHKGLLAGESLLLSVNQMEKSYIDKNTRSLEIEKTISLLHLDPRSFLEFKQGVGGIEKGTLCFELSEKLFDFDFPSHYQRRIKSISVTIPAVVGPYQSINATLVQNKNIIVMKNDIDAVRYATNPVQYPNYKEGSIKENWLVNQQIAISRAMEDSGMFVLDFNSEQYLPFEGTGAVSKWTLSLPPETNRIDFSSISDVIITVKYTASDGGSEFANQVKDFLHTEQSPYPYKLSKYIDLKQAFPLEWKIGIDTLPIQGLQRFFFLVTDKIILPNLLDTQLGSVTVVLNTADEKLVGGDDFLYLRTTDEVRVPITICNNIGTVSLQGDIPVKANWSLEFDITKTPADLLKIDVEKTENDESKALNGEVLLDIAVLVEYESNVFKKGK